MALNNLNESYVLVLLQLHSIAAIRSKCRISQSEQRRYLGLDVNVSGSNPRRSFHFTSLQHSIM